MFCKYCGTAYSGTGCICKKCGKNGFKYSQNGYFDSKELFDMFTFLGADEEMPESDKDYEPANAEPQAEFLQNDVLQNDEKPVYQESDACEEYYEKEKYEKQFKRKVLIAGIMCILALITVIAYVCLRM